MLADQDAASASVQIIGAMIWLGVAAVLVGLAFWAVRRYIRRSFDDTGPDGFTLHDLRRMHRDGELTDAQFDAAKASLLVAAGTHPAGGLSDEPEDPRAGQSSDKSSSGDRDGPLDGNR